MLEYKVATMLDLQMRPVEAQIRYQRFLHSLDIERIRAQGDANAQLADAIARAQQRLIILERQAPAPAAVPSSVPPASTTPATPPAPTAPITPPATPPDTNTRPSATR
jgi:hypothetical protein